MARKGKEPAGLRRWRLAQKAKKTARRTARSAPTRKVKTMARRRYGKRRGHRTMKPSILTTGALIYKAYDSYQASQAAGSEKLNTFLTNFTGIKFGRFATGGDMFDMDYFIQKNALLGAAIGGSYALNYLPQTKTIIRKVPMVGRRFKW